jgi:two-component system, NarL family, sensor histidine kinase DesK
MSDGGPLRIGQPPENRRQRLIKLCWTLLWMVYLAYPVGDLVSGRHTVPAQVAGWVALAGFLGGYGLLVLRRQVMGESSTWQRSSQLALLVAMGAIGTATSYTLGSQWLTLLSYTAVATGAVLSARRGLQGVAGVAGYLILVGSTCRDVNGFATATAALSAFLGGAAMTGLQRLVSTLRELREARAAVAALSASAERLRMARDLHDLLGHSLSLITLKTELTARFLDQERYQEARAQVGDIEKVSRQALVDVREAIGGYRQPKLAVELAAVRTALSAADVVVDADPAIAEGHPGLGPEGEGALGWALREAVTNVVRHSGATSCVLRLAEVIGEDGARALRLEVADDGVGVRRAGRGNGLSGLAERLALADGTLETGPGPRGRGFSLRATVPLRARAFAPIDQSVAGTVQQ